MAALLSGTFGRLSLTGVGRNVDIDLPRLLSSPAAANLDALDVGGMWGDCSRVGPNLSRLRYVNLYRTRVSVAGVDALLHSPHCRISELELGGYDLGAELVNVLAKSPRLARLTKLGLSFTPSLGGDAL